MCECSICLNPVRYTRKSKQLECGHLYHGNCIDDWISSGGNTCPMCRSLVHKPTFKITISIQNTETQRETINEITDEDVIQLILSRFRIDDLVSSSEMILNVETLEELDQIISDFGIARGIDINSLIFNTE